LDILEKDEDTDMISIVGALTFGLATIMYILLALGLPFGEFAMGGKYKKMPPKLRIACGEIVVLTYK
jgi:hypothetical protein